MRLVHLSDLHITAGPRLDDQRATLRAIVDAALETSPDLWLLTGDFYGRTVPHRSLPAERELLYQEVSRMAFAAPVVIVYGNHDYELDLDTMQHLGGEWPIYVVSSPTTLEVETAAGPASVYCMPYPTKRFLLADPEAPKGLVASQEAVEAKLATLLAAWGARMRGERARDPRRPQILAGHFQVRGTHTAGGEVLAGHEIEFTTDQLDALPLDYGALGHIHLQQEPGLRCWYPGSPWRNDFGETDPKGWHLVQIVTDGSPIAARTVSAQDHALYQRIPGERLATYVERRASPCREFVTLEYRWAADHEDGTPRWVIHPELDAFARISRTQAEVRMRLIVPEQWVAGCPWKEEVARVLALGAVRIQEERRIEPRIRVREGASAVAATLRLPEKFSAYWQTLGTPPDPVEQDAALAALHELETSSDEQILGATQKLIGRPASPVVRA